jgi:hypothetical protein
MLEAEMLFAERVPDQKPEKSLAEKFPVEKSLAEKRSLSVFVIDLNRGVLAIEGFGFPTVGHRERNDRLVAD